LKSSSKILNSSELVLVGKVVAAHGIKGAVKAVFYTESIDIFHSDRILWTKSGNGVFDMLKVSWCKPHCRGIRMGFSSVLNRNQAEAMAGLELYLEKSQLPVLEKDTYYWFELIGLRVKTVKDEFIGYIEHILPTSGTDVYVVKQAANNSEKEYLIPAAAKFIQQIDLADKTMTVDLPQGLNDFEG
jgi:16S rRNA processing protein RimM